MAQALVVSPKDLRAAVVAVGTLDGGWEVCQGVFSKILGEGARVAATGVNAKVLAWPLGYSVCLLRHRGWWRALEVRIWRNERNWGRVGSCVGEPWCCGLGCQRGWWPGESRERVA